MKKYEYQAVSIHNRNFLLACVISLFINIQKRRAYEIVDLLSRINASGTTIIMATHNMDIVKKLKHRVVGLEGGKMIGDTKDKTQNIKLKTQNKEEGQEESLKETKETKEDKKNKTN